MIQLIKKIPPFTLLLVFLSVVNGAIFAVEQNYHLASLNGDKWSIIAIVLCLYAFILLDDANFRRDKALFKSFFSWKRKHGLKAIFTLSILINHLVLIFFIYITLYFNAGRLISFYLLIAIWLIIIIYFYFLLIRPRLKAHVEPLAKFVFTLLMTILVFAAKMISSDMLKELADVGPDKLFYFNWLLFGLMFVILIAVLFYISLFVIFAFIDKAAKGKHNFSQSAINKFLITALAYFLTLMFFIVLCLDAILGSLLKTFYPFDTVSSFKCDTTYYTIPGFGSEAGYAAINENEYRAFYLENGRVQLLTIQCKKEEKTPETKVVYRYLPAPAPTRHVSAAKPANRKKTTTPVMPKKKEPVLPYQCYDIKRAKDLLAENTDAKRKEAEKKVKALCTPAAPVKK